MSGEAGLPAADRCSSPHVEISLDNLLHNLSTVRGRLPDSARVIAVVKDAAYGCGAAAVGRALVESGVELLAVARLEEAAALRDEGLSVPVLVLGSVPDSSIAWCAAHDVHAAINGIEDVPRMAAIGEPLEVHCNVDTGMGRLGVAPGEVAELCRLLQGSSVRLSGMFTHFPCSDSPADRAVAQQVAVFEKCVAHVRAGGLDPRFVHCSNSGAVFGHPWPACATHARPGIVLYGCSPDPTRPVEGLRQVLSLKASVVRVRRVPADTPVSYGWTYRTNAETCIATVNAGYGQGVPRYLSNRGHMLVRGARFPIAGRVTMDYCMLDVGLGGEVQMGDEAVVIGSQGAEAITADQVAVLGGTIGYEVLCNAGARIPRAYLRDGGVAARQGPLLY